MKGECALTLEVAGSYRATCPTHGWIDMHTWRYRWQARREFYRHVTEVKETRGLGGWVCI